MMGVYQGVTAAEQSLRMAPTMWYHLLRLGSIVMAPKLFGKFLENGRGAKLLAAGILAKPGSPQAGSIAAALETMAKGLGAQQLRALPAATGAVATELPNQPKQVAQP